MFTLYVFLTFMNFYVEDFPSREACIADGINKVVHLVPIQHINLLACVRQGDET